MPFNNEYFIDKPEDSLERQLSKILLNTTGLNEQQATYIDKILSKYCDTNCAKVDRLKLKDSMEAWVYVVVKENDDCNFYGFNQGRGVLTWTNSD